MPNTQIQRWMRETPEHVSKQVEQLIPHRGYTWTGYSGAQYECQIVWQLCVWNIQPKTLLLLDVLLAPYLVEH